MAGLETELISLQVYRFAMQNCADRVFEMFCDRRTSRAGTRLLSIPQEELREIVAAGWTLPPVQFKSLSSKCVEPLHVEGGPALEWRIRQIRLDLRNAARSENPHEVDRLRNRALNVAKQALLVPDEPLAPADLVQGLRSSTTVQVDKDPVLMRRGPDVRFAGMTDGQGSMGWRAGIRAGSFDFINSDPNHFQASALEVLSAEAGAWGQRPALRRLTLLHLDTLELETETAEGQVRWIDVGWNRIDGPKVGSRTSPSEAGISFGTGFSWGWLTGLTGRASLGPLAGVGASWNAPGADDQARFEANLGLRGQVQLNPGRTPRVKISAEWRGLAKNSPYRSRVETVFVPWEFQRGSLFCGYTETDHRWKEWFAGLSLPLR
jgi:hypothetical protein